VIDDASRRRLELGEQGPHGGTNGSGTHPRLGAQLASVADARQDTEMLEVFVVEPQRLGEGGQHLG